MTTKKIAVITTLTFLVFVIAALIAELVFKPKGIDRLLLVGGLTLLGLIAALLVFLYLSARARRAAAQGGAGKRDDLIPLGISRHDRRSRDRRRPSRHISGFGIAGQGARGHRGR